MNHTSNSLFIWKRTFWTCYDHFGLIITISILWLFCSFTIILIPPVTASIFHVAYLLINKNQVKLSIFFYGILKYFFKSILITLFFVFCFLLIFSNIQFYFFHFDMLGMILAGLSFWIFIFLILTSMYVFPLIILDYSYKNIIKYSFLISATNTIFTLKFVFFTALLIILGIILPFIGVGFLAVLSQEMLRELQAKYNNEIIVDNPNRSLKELLKPWDYT